MAKSNKSAKVGGEESAPVEKGKGFDVFDSNGVFIRNVKTEEKAQAVAKELSGRYEAAKPKAKAKKEAKAEPEV